MRAAIVKGPKTHHPLTFEHHL